MFVDRYGKPHFLNPNTKATERSGVFALIVNTKHEVLLVRPKGSTVWELPGGGVEIGEDKFQALVREVKEETNLDIVITQEKIVNETTGIVKDVIQYYADDVASFWHYNVTCYCVSVSGDLLPGNEIEEAKWFSGVTFTEPWINFLHRKMLNHTNWKNLIQIEVSGDSVKNHNDNKSINWELWEILKTFPHRTV